MSQQIVTAIVKAHESGELEAALTNGEDGFKQWLKAMGKAQGRKGKRLFLPTRLALTGSLSVRLASIIHRYKYSQNLLGISLFWTLQGPEIGGVLELLASENGDVVDRDNFVPLADRINALQAWLSKQA